MKKLEWPSIAVAATLICAGTIIFAIWRDPDGFKLKDWQTFMAACVALIGGALAYRGAMAKVEFDRQVHQVRVDREELGVYLRLNSTLTFVAQFASVMVRKLSFFLNEKGASEIVVADLDPRMKFDVNEAWANLDMFEAPIAKNIAELKTNLDAYYIAIGDYQGAVWKKTYTGDAPEDARQFQQLAERIVTLSAKIIAGLQKNIKDY